MMISRKREKVDNVSYQSIKTGDCPSSFQAVFYNLAVISFTDEKAFRSRETFCH